ncbi:MAG: hypothetical protein U1F43_10355 [Myxococcota bacterium]
MKLHAVVLGALAFGIGGGACGGKGAVSLTGKAQEKWTTLCVTCHGDTGHGDGPNAKTLKVKPRSFADAAWQDSVDDAHIRKIILEGGAAVGKSDLMPANPDLVGKDEAVLQLIAKVRSFKP